ncbi:MAG: hypothetical protein ACI90M_004777, partial [Candidatus Azotimanducaceae bacterium]
AVDLVDAELLQKGGVHSLGTVYGGQCRIKSSPDLAPNGSRPANS